MTEWPCVRCGKLTLSRDINGDPCCWRGCVPKCQCGEPLTREFASRTWTCPKYEAPRETVGGIPVLSKHDAISDRTLAARKDRYA